MSDTLKTLRLVKWMVAFLLLAGWGVCVQALPAVAFFYGANPPWGELQAFDSVVVDPDHVPQPTSLRKKLPHTSLVAYVALGEVQPSRAYADAIPKDWLLGENKDWEAASLTSPKPHGPLFLWIK